ncbi:hypothetical protein OIE66_33725 [Nonomuraea sp. NBC_01738]|uniref:hypothetical protein n=1 Tax=Nonomuraea sp. NBC_01738 TaxID=2976003 RepID=UPI002E139205|nr:hypothetical protein OIE66_33725 [Nonomuraea sp. NBC_01738]
MIKHLAVVAAAVAGLGVLSISPAQADAAQAQGPINYSCGPKIHSGGGMYMTEVRGRRGKAVLKSGSRGWYVEGAGLRRGDRVSLDWSDNGGRSYHACHAVVRNKWGTALTWTVDEVPGRSFRACVKSKGTWRCTHGWWKTRWS